MRFGRLSAWSAHAGDGTTCPSPLFGYIKRVYRRVFRLEETVKLPDTLFEEFLQYLDGTGPYSADSMCLEDIQATTEVKTRVLAQHLRQQRPAPFARSAKFGKDELVFLPDQKKSSSAISDELQVADEEGDADLLVHALRQAVDDENGTGPLPSSHFICRCPARHSTLQQGEKIPLGDIFDFSKAKSPWGGELNMFAEFAEKNLEAEMAAWELNFDEALDIIDID
ncbi:hypothetical protein HGRIS_003858 [Hohenbuehelia grisea]|uniref:Uncharacterized protein n=1 Tax=Hohenbuehelia grisea TaxID=104357 RepID=A0ABR3JIG0_9AGAR